MRLSPHRDHHRREQRPRGTEKHMSLEKTMFASTIEISGAPRYDKKRVIFLKTHRINL